MDNTVTRHDDRVSEVTFCPVLSADDGDYVLAVFVTASREYEMKINK